MAAFSSCKFSCDLDSGSGECDENHPAISMGWIRSMIDPYAANPDHHRKIYSTKYMAMRTRMMVPIPPPAMVGTAPRPRRSSTLSLSLPVLQRMATSLRDLLVNPYCTREYFPFPHYPGEHISIPLARRRQEHLRQPSRFVGAQPEMLARGQGDFHRFPARDVVQPAVQGTVAKSGRTRAAASDPIMTVPN